MNDLAAQSLTLTLGATRALDDVTVAFAPGEVTAVLGPNGAGKSTLMACLAGLMSPDTGLVRIGDMPCGAVPRRELARRIGYLPQTADVHWDIDVGTLVALGRFPHRGRWGDNAADRAAVARAMATTDVAHVAHRVVNSLSGGERARVLLARVLAGEPEWLLADEPLANLDLAHQIDGLDGLRGVAAAGAGVVVVLHDLNHAARVADRIVLMKAGRVMAHGHPDKVLTPPIIADVFGVAVHMATMADGRRVIVPAGPGGPP